MMLRRPFFWIIAAIIAAFAVAPTIGNNIELRESLPKTGTHRVQKAELKKEGVTRTTWDREKARASAPAR